MSALTPFSEHMFPTGQMDWKKGLKIFQEKGELAIKKLQQIHNMEGFEPKNRYDLTKEPRASALKYLMYLKAKYDGNLKGRGCADGWPQQPYISKSEGSSSTLTLTGLIITCIIDAYKIRDITTVDIPRAFLQTKMPQDKKEIHVVSDGRMAELLTKISPETYQEYIHQKHGQAYIYCKQNVALYGTSWQLCYSGRG